MGTEMNANQSRPLVTLALFAYNQEKYVREAVAGALAQNYEPLEIILSDDCSSDRTFDIIQQMASAYSGPHRVIVRRNEINLITAQHVQAVANVMSGELMVVAAGDDISVESRVKRLVEKWLAYDKRPVVIHSQAAVMLEDGTRTGDIYYPRIKGAGKVNIEWFLRYQRNPVLSPTAAYVERLFRDFPPIIGGSLIEDGPLIVRGMLCGDFIAVDEPLVFLRRLRESSGTGYSCRNLGRWNRFVRSRMISAFNKLQDIPHGRVTEAHKNRLESMTVRDLRRLSRCIFKSNSADSLAGRIWIAIALILIYPNKGNFRGVIGFALQFAGFLKKRA